MPTKYTNQARNSKVSYLVDDDHRVRREVWVAGDLPQQEPLRKEQNARASSPGRVEAHLEGKSGGGGGSA